MRAGLVVLVAVVGASAAQASGGWSAPRELGTLPFADIGEVARIGDELIVGAEHYARIARAETCLHVAPPAGYTAVGVLDGRISPRAVLSGDIIAGPIAYGRAGALAITSRSTGISAVECYPLGSASLTWLSPDGRVRGTVALPDGDDTIEAKLAPDGAGGFVAAWVQQHAATPTLHADRLQIALISADGTVSAPRAIAQTTATPDDVGIGDIAIAPEPRADIAILYTERRKVVLAERDRLGHMRWTLVSRLNGTADEVRLGVSRSGGLIAAWSDFYGFLEPGGTEVFVGSRPPGGVDFTHRRRLDRGGSEETGYDLWLAVTPKGHAAVEWDNVEGDSDAQQVWLSTGSLRGGFSRARRLARSGYAAGVVAAPGGSALATWGASNGLTARVIGLDAGTTGPAQIVAPRDGGVVKAIWFDGHRPSIVWVSEDRRDVGHLRIVHQR